MPKTVTASRAVPARIAITLREGQVTGLEVTVEVNYGAFGQVETVDLLSELTAAQSATLQAIADRVANRVRELYLL